MTSLAVQMSTPPSAHPSQCRPSPTPHTTTTLNEVLLALPAFLQNTGLLREQEQSFCPQCSLAAAQGQGSFGWGGSGRPRKERGREMRIPAQRAQKAALCAGSHVGQRGECPSLKGAQGLACEQSPRKGLTAMESQGGSYGRAGQGRRTPGRRAGHAFVQGDPEAQPQQP